MAEISFDALDYIEEIETEDLLMELKCRGVDFTIEVEDLIKELRDIFKPEANSRAGLIFTELLRELK